MGRLCCSCERTISSPPWISSWVRLSRSVPPSTPCVSDAVSASEGQGDHFVTDESSLESIPGPTPLLVEKTKIYGVGEDGFYKTMLHHHPCGDMEIHGLLSGHWMCKSMYVQYTVMYGWWAWTAWSIHASSVCQFFFLLLWVEAFCIYTQMKLQIC